MTHARRRQYFNNLREKVKFWPVLGIAVLVLSFLTWWQIGQLRESDQLQAEKISALSMALEAEQSAQRAKGETPVAPPPDEIVDDPTIIRGEPGVDGEDGRDGSDGAPGVKGDKGEPGKVGPTGPSGLPGADGQDGQDGQDGEPGESGQDGADGSPGQDGVDGQNGEPPYGWSSYDRQGRLIYECSRVPEPEWDPERPRYECRGARDEDPVIIGGN